jgi:hypothetical protein
VLFSHTSSAPASQQYFSLTINQPQPPASRTRNSGSCGSLTQKSQNQGHTLHKLLGCLLLWQCLLPSKFQKFYKIPRHIKSLDACMEQ